MLAHHPHRHVHHATDAATRLLVHASVLTIVAIAVALTWLA